MDAAILAVFLVGSIFGGVIVLAALSGVVVNRPRQEADATRYAPLDVQTVTYSMRGENSPGLFIAFPERGPVYLTDFDLYISRVRLDMLEHGLMTANPKFADLHDGGRRNPTKVVGNGRKSKDVGDEGEARRDS